MKTVKVSIYGRKEPGYPQMDLEISFETIEELLRKIDEEADKMDWRKIDVRIAPDGLSEEEIIELENSDCIVSNF